MPLKEINTGYTQLYNQIFCNLFPTNNGFNTCKNCSLNFDSSNPYSFTTTEGGEQSCLNKCSSDETCTSYQYYKDKSDNNCITYIDFPKEIVDSEEKINSGYSLQFPYDYETLNLSQKNNVREKCATQYLNNYFYPDKNIDLTDCLTFTNSDYLTNFDIDKKCLFNVLNDNQIKTTIVNNSIDGDSENDNKENIGYKSDPIIDKYIKTYNDYNDKKTAEDEINKISDIGSGNIVGDSSFYEKTLKEKRDKLTDVSNTILNEIGTIESFNNHSKKNFYFLITILFILILFMYFYFFIK
jgi:hypothetical protein